MNNQNQINTTVDLLTTRGYAILENLAGLDAMSRVEQELSLHFSQVDSTDEVNHTKRIHSRVLAGATELQSRMIDPVILGVMDRLLGDNCVKYQLSSIQGIEVHPGASKQGLHRDDDIFFIPHPHPVFEVNVMWAVTDFTAENGATHLIRNSHNWPSGRTPSGETEIQAEMKRGSALIWLGSTWHGAGANQTANRPPPSPQKRCSLPSRAGYNGVQTP